MGLDVGDHLGHDDIVAPSAPAAWERSTLRSVRRSNERDARESLVGPMKKEPPLEWIGGFISPPFVVTDRETPYRPSVVVWLELPSMLVVAHQVAPPEATAGLIGQSLLAALESPHVGSPRTPDSIRVSSEELAAEVRSAAPSIRVGVAPTPELDEISEAMSESISGVDDEASYLRDGQISEESVEDLFAAAALLYRIAPWRTATESQVLRMDIPALGVEGACLSITGNDGERRGVLIFLSLEGFEAFAREPDPRELRSGQIDAGTSWLELAFEHEDDIPDAMFDEIVDHDWPVESEDAYPILEHYEQDGSSKPLVERDVRVAAACAFSLSSFFVKHGPIFRRPRFEPLCESYFDEDDLEVRFTVPYDAYELFDIDEDAAPPTFPIRNEPKVGRNDPCPCGSGRKYKKCHMRDG